MLCVFIGEKNRVTLDKYFQIWARKLSPSIPCVAYEALPLYPRLTASAFIFTDLERLCDKEIQRLIPVADRIEQAGGLILNSPKKVLRRFDLLRSLAADGTNPYQVHRIDADPQSLRYPVFIRRELEHNGPLTPLLHDPHELSAALEKLRCGPIKYTDLMIAEYVHTADENKVFRKYSALRIGTRLIPRHILFSADWVEKYSDVVTDDNVKEECDFLELLPHREDIWRIFERANIDYGRIDYSLQNGKLICWEINTNPGILPSPEQCDPRRLAGQWHSSVKIQEAFGELLAAKPVAVNLGRVQPIVGVYRTRRRMIGWLACLWNTILRTKSGYKLVWALRYSLSIASDAHTRHIREI
jgi:hypothetical protein